VGKRVVVVGIGNSGADVAGEISRVAEQVCHYILIMFLGGSFSPVEYGPCESRLFLLF
jgi:hypothetical protein